MMNLRHWPSLWWRRSCPSDLQETCSSQIKYEWDQRQRKILVDKIDGHPTFLSILPERLNLLTHTILHLVNTSGEELQRQKDLNLAEVSSLPGALMIRSVGFGSSRLFTSFISRAMTVEHGCAKSLSALPLSFHSMSCSVGGAKSMETTRSEKSDSCSLMNSLLSSLVWSTINLRFLFPLFFSEFAEKKQEKLWRFLEFGVYEVSRA